jgi:hypothetical protein
MKRCAEPYYTLVSSLPHLARFDRAERLPITRYRLDLYLHMLREDDARQLALAAELVSWRPEHVARARDEDVIRQYRALCADELFHPALREYVDFRIDQMTVVAAARKKRLGGALPGKNGGAGRWPRWVAAHWGDPGFKLAGVLPWLPDALACFVTGDMVRLEWFLMSSAWKRLAVLAERDQFGFEAVFSYVFRWDIVNSWLLHNEEQGAVRFQELMKEVMHERRQ